MASGCVQRRCEVMLAALGRLGIAQGEGRLHSELRNFPEVFANSAGQKVLASSIPAKLPLSCRSATWALKIDDRHLPLD